jgi:hypothetical protein
MSHNDFIEVFGWDEVDLNILDGQPQATIPPSAARQSLMQA